LSPIFCKIPFRYAVELIETVGKNYEKRTDQEGQGMRQLQQQKTSAQIISGEKQVILN